MHSQAIMQASKRTSKQAIQDASEQSIVVQFCGIVKRVRPNQEIVHTMGKCRQFCHTPMRCRSVRLRTVNGRDVALSLLP